MLNCDPYNILNRDPSINHLIEVKLNVKNSILFNDQTKRTVLLLLTVLDSMLFLNS